MASERPTGPRPTPNAIGRKGASDADWKMAREIDRRIADLEAENERLRAENMTLDYQFGELLNHSVSEEEYERLRAALQKIAAEAPTRVQVGQWDGIEIERICRAALAAKEQR